jgi:cytochrome d ubiquinol oxidase subunit I
MSDFLYARSQMGISLAFHIVFAAIGISLPVLMSISEALYLRTGRPVFLELSKRWSHGAALLFAVGAVSGTVLSFELGLLWPGFMEKSGAIIGMPFSLEGFAFFAEAIFLGLFLMGWKRLPPLVHWLCGVIELGHTVSGSDKVSTLEHNFSRQPFANRRRIFLRRVHINA